MEKANFEDFMGTLYPTNRTFEFYVDWVRAFHNIDNIRIELSILNGLIGCDDLEKELSMVIKKYPEVVKVFPILIAERANDMSVLTNYTSNPWVYRDFNFIIKESYNEKEIENFIYFIKATGVFDLIKSKKITNLIDYVLGIEVGIGTNGRKNRGGKIGEQISKHYIKQFCEENDLEYLEEANSKKIQDSWSIEVPVDKSSRRYDFVVKVEERVIIFESNFYSGGGSKLKAVAGEFRGLHNLLKKVECVKAFVWLTDGKGWATAKKPLEEAYFEIDYIFNNKMLSEGVLSILLED